MRVVSEVTWGIPKNRGRVYTKALRARKMLVCMFVGPSVECWKLATGEPLNVIVGDRGACISVICLMDFVF